MGLYVGKLLLILGFILIYVFSCMCLYCCCGTHLQCSQIAAKQATSMLLKHLAMLSGHIVEEAGACKMVRASHEGWSVGGGNQEDVTTELDPGNWKLLILSLSLECTFCPPFPQWEVFQGQSWESMCCWDHLDRIRDWTPLRGLRSSILHFFSLKGNNLFII